MAAPTPGNPPSRTESTSSLRGFAASLPQGAKTASHFLRTFGFHLVAALLGIALAFL